MHHREAHKTPQAFLLPPIERQETVIGKDIGDMQRLPMHGNPAHSASPKGDALEGKATDASAGPRTPRVRGFASLRLPTRRSSREPA